jgi:hypothetical protein
MPCDESELAKQRADRSKQRRMLKYPDYRFEERRDESGEWQPMPVTWMSTDDDAIRAACASIHGARKFVAQCNAECGSDRFRVVTE